MRATLQWLYPGLGIKRWVLLALAGGVLLLYSLLVLNGAFLSDDLLRGLGQGSLVGKTGAGVLLAIDGAVAGAVMLFFGARRVWRFQRTNPETVTEIRTASRLARGPRIAAVGGGTGLAALLRGLKAYTSNLTAVVTMADDGGSSGLLRRDMGMPPPGDLRNCLVALADDESVMSKLFQYRFPDGGLQGHSFGNLFMAALAEVTGDFERAVAESTHVLKVRGRVLPSTMDDVVLHAQLEGGGEVSGESTITAADRLPLRVWLTPEEPLPVPQSIAAIRRADLVVLGPGSLYTSVIPNLLIPEVRRALKETRGWVVYVCNVMTQPGESDGFTASDHVRAIEAHTGRKVFNHVIVNKAVPSEALAVKYHASGQELVIPDTDRLKAMGLRPIVGDFINETDVVRHDPMRLADAIFKLANGRK
jgi:uncharacterized cofD-like protein